NGFEIFVKPLLARHCISCHNPELKTANLDLSVFTNASTALAERHVWELARRKIRAGEMPPAPLPRPAEDSIEAATRWMDQQIERYDASHKPDPGRITMRRLNRAEYNNTVRDLLGIDFRPADDFPIDDSGYGFDNIGDVLSVSPILIEKYLT